MAAPAKTGIKNPFQKVSIRMLDGKKVVPCLYNGRACGHGKYFAAMVGDQLIVDEHGKPLPFNGAGEMVEQ